VAWDVLSKDGGAAAGCGQATAGKTCACDRRIKIGKSRAFLGKTGKNRAFFAKISQKSAKSADVSPRLARMELSREQVNL